MNQQETIELWERCEAARAEARAAALAAGETEYDAEETAHKAAKAVWNGWAEDILAKRKALEEAGEWAADPWGKPQNKATRAWMEAAVADFSRMSFPIETHAHREEPPLCFNGFIFPGIAGFERAQFNRAARFEGAQFYGRVRFDDAEFCGVPFVGAARFKKAQFYDEVRFRAVKFGGTARFERAQYHGRVSFERAQFDRGAFFSDAKFGGNTSFFLVQFMQYACFDRAKFRREANFGAIRSNQGFSMANAAFEEAPRLDNIAVVPPNGAAADATSKYRALKRLAIQAHDHVRELEFFKYELQSRLANKEDPWPICLAIRAYGLLSDFGRSFMRPLGIWAALVLFFAGIYWLSARPYCPDGSWPSWHSIYLAAKNGLAVLSGAQDQRSTDAYLCLYGEQSIKPATVPDPHLPQVKPTATGNPAIPFAITFLEFLHAILSVILLFLVALGIRNQFQIK